MIGLILGEGLGILAKNCVVILANLKTGRDVYAMHTRHFGKRKHIKTKII